MNIIIFFIIIIFSLICLAILFFIKTRTNRIIALISSHLAIILLFDIYLNSFNNFKEIVLVITIYSMTVLFLISDNKSFYVELKEAIETNNFFKLKLPFLLLIFGTILAVILIAIKIPDINKIISQKKINRDNEMVINPLILPSHPVHIAVKKFYLGKKFDDNFSDSISVALEKNEKKRAKLKDKLQDNIFLKSSSNIILIIVASLTALLILSSNKTKEETL
ncbi:MAG: hypothetical protein ACKN9I_01515 [Alphaproteobacteria bacterium]